MAESYRVKGSVRITDNTPARPTPPIPNFQESALVFVLGHQESLSIDYVLGEDGLPISGELLREKKKRIEQFTNVNGYHVRTIPGTRWVQPVMVAAGAGRLAVVDRGDTQDLIRVTNKYGGANPQYSDDHLAYPDFDWSTVADDFVINVPAGYRVTGMQILERDVLVAGLASETGWATETQTYFLTFDFLGTASLGNKTSPEITDLLEMREIPNGSAWGRPGMTHHAQAHDPISFASMARPVDGKTSAFTHRYNLHRQSLRGERSLPTGWHPLGLTSAYGMINALTTATEPTGANVDPHVAEDDIGARRLYRMVADPRLNELLPFTPTTVEITKTFAAKDSVPVKDIRYAPNMPLKAEDADAAASLAAYIDFIDKNKRTFDTASTPLSERVQVAEVLFAQDTVEGSDTPKNHQIYVHYIDLGKEVIDIDSCGNHTMELTRHRVNDTPNDSVDDTKPMFNSVHTSHYDWLSNGGYSYKTDEG